MILGQGAAQTDAEILAEYDRFLVEAGRETSTFWKRLHEAPRVMQQRIGKPVREWTDEDILQLYADQPPGTRYVYNAFLAFLLFRGYHRASLCLLTSLPANLSNHHPSALRPYREQLEQAQKRLGYAPASVGSELVMLIDLLAVIGKPLGQLARSDFDAFRAEYQAWCQAAGVPVSSRPFASLSRLERYLVELGFLPPAQVVFRHAEHFAGLQAPAIRAAVLAYLAWCDVRYQPSTIRSKEAALSHFFFWFQDYAPHSARLDQVTRAVSLEYARHLQEQVAAGDYCSRYRTDLYQIVRRFFEFAILEHLETAPSRNPFGPHDTPRHPDPVPRYIVDHELRHVLAYCHNGAKLKERIIVITMLHTGIRAAEFVTLKNSDVVQIQGKWQLHIHQGKGLKDRLLPLTTEALSALQCWQAEGWERINDYLFTSHGRPWTTNCVGTLIRRLGQQLGIAGLTPHRFRHSFAVALLNYGMRETALQKLMGHATLNMTLEYARILDRTVEQSFNQAIDRMHVGALGWVPSFFAPEDYALFSEGDSLNWIRLPLGYCRRNLKLHCESDVKCLWCDRFCALPADLPRLQEMCQRFLDLGLTVKAEVVAAQIQHLEARPDQDRPLTSWPVLDTSIFMKAQDAELAYTLEMNHDSRLRHGPDR